MEKIAIYTANKSYGALVPLSLGFISINAEVHVSSTETKHNIYPKIGFPEIEVGQTYDYLIIISANALLRYYTEKPKIKAKKKAIILTDTILIKRNKQVLKKIKKYNGTIFAMVDLFKYLPFKVIPYHPPVKLWEGFSPHHKSDELLISHSPGHKYGQNKKGSVQIEKITKNMGYDIQTIKDLSWKDCIMQKANSHIFIDQLIKNNPFAGRINYDKNYNGGIGKSGAEAMVCGCATITSGDDIDTQPYYRKPPIIFCDYVDFWDKLQFVIDNYEEIANEQKNWADLHLHPTFVAQHILRNI